MSAALEVENLKLNYFALFIAIVKDKSVSQACSDMDLITIRKDKRKKVIRSNDTKNEDLERAIKMKENGVSWDDIGEEFGVVKETMFQRVKRYMGKDWDNRKW